MSDADPDPVAIRIRRSQAFGIAGLLLGLALGILLGTTVLDGDDQQTLQLPPGLNVGGGGPAVPETVDVEVGGRPARGPADAKVTVLEFTDYECPFCGKHFRDTLPQLQKEYGDRIRYVVRNFPLENVHRHARKAAEASECAFTQNKFFEYHDLLFENQKNLEVSRLKRYARRVGLDGARFDECLDTGVSGPAVEADMRDGQEYGVTGTPTFFINGKRLEGAQPFERLEAEINAALGG